MINRLLLSLLIISFTPLSVKTQSYGTLSTNEPLSLNSIFTTLNHSELLEASLTTDLDQLMANIKTETYQPGVFSFVDQNGRTVTYDVKLRPRGKFRRRVCDFPPLKMKFSEQQLVANGYALFNSVKLVTHCLKDKVAGENNVLREYLAYRIFNLISSNSYKVQLVKINYINSNDPKDKLTRYAFMIEGTKEMAYRLGGEECECVNPPRDIISKKDENLVALFQYLIGNEDWNIKMLRNLKLAKPVDGSAMIPVPYDFDFSGFVNAPYALPNSDLNMQSVTERALLGWHVDPKRLKVNVNYYEVKRTAIEELISNFKLLGLNTRDELLLYIETFYYDLDKIIAMNKERQRD